MENNPRNTFFDHLQARPVLVSCLFEGSLAVLAVALGLLFGLRPWTELDYSSRDLTLAILATAVLLLPLPLLNRVAFDWVREIEQLIRDTLVPLFRNTGVAGLGLVSLMAGVGEEMLFRGIIQAGLDTWLGPMPALVLASLLFGLAHCMTRAYFLLATLMGVYLGLLYLWTGNLLVAILVHALYDWVMLTHYMRRYGR